MAIVLAERRIMKDVFAKHYIMSHLRERPALYLRKKSISDFSLLILGYELAYMEIRNAAELYESTPFQPELSLFMQWLSWKYRIHFYAVVTA